MLTNQLMRTLWCLIVVCVVAATTARPADTRSELGPAAIERAARPAVGAHALRSCLHAIDGPRAHVPGLQLPPAALAAPFTPRIPPARALARSTGAWDRIFAALVLTRSARGPPIA